MTRVRRGFGEIYRETRLLQDPTAAHARARDTQVTLGVHATERLRACGVGVPLMWPTAPVRLSRSTPLGIRVFQAMTLPPASWLWAASHTTERIVTSIHVEFVDDIARVCEAVDIRPDGVGSEYALSLEPVATAVGRCLDVAGFGRTPSVSGLQTRFKACFPFRWEGRQATGIPAEQMRSLIVHFACEPESTPSVTDDIRARCTDVPALPERPSRSDLTAVLESFFTGGPTTS